MALGARLGAERLGGRREEQSTTHIVPTSQHNNLGECTPYWQFCRTQNMRWCGGPMLKYDGGEYALARSICFLFVRGH
jgi:hypothetical protein